MLPRLQGGLQAISAGGFVDLLPVKKWPNPSPNQENEHQIREVTRLTKYPKADMLDAVIASRNGRNIHRKIPIQLQGWSHDISASRE